jgi:hypothetical protein
VKSLRSVATTLHLELVSEHLGCGCRYSERDERAVSKTQGVGRSGKSDEALIVEMGGD